MPIVSDEDLNKRYKLYFESDNIQSPLTTHITYYIFKYKNVIFEQPSDQLPITIYDLNCKCPSIKIIPLKNEKYHIEYNETGLSVYCNVKNTINIKHEGIFRIFGGYLTPYFWHCKSENKIDSVS